MHRLAVRISLGTSLSNRLLVPFCPLIRLRSHIQCTYCNAMVVRELSGAGEQLVCTRERYREAKGGAWGRTRQNRVGRVNRSARTADDRDDCRARTSTVLDLACF
jgi:hypothetical protein